MVTKRFNFLIESLKTIKKSGTITQSGSALCKAMTDHISSGHKVILEIGAGDGAVTKYILDAMADDAILLSFEINEVHYQRLATISDPRLIPIFDSAEFVIDYLEKHNLEKADTIISGLPFLVLPTELTMSILSTCHKALRKDQLFVQFNYSRGLRKLYRSIFTKVEEEFVLLNAPPAIVFRCKK